MLTKYAHNGSKPHKFVNPVNFYTIANLFLVGMFLHSALYTANRFTMHTKFPSAHNTKQLYLGMMHNVADSLVLHLFSNFSRKPRQ